MRRRDSDFARPKTASIIRMSVSTTNQGEYFVFSHVMVGVSNLEKSKKFYDAVLGTIGIGPGVANKDRYFYMSPGGVFAITKPINGKARTSANGGTIGFAVKSGDQAKAWHAAGIANGGTTCEDPPGLRENGMYLAYLRDPDGNKICALCRPQLARAPTKDERMRVYRAAITWPEREAIHDAIAAYKHEAIAKRVELGKRYLEANRGAGAIDVPRERAVATLDLVEQTRAARDEAIATAKGRASQHDSGSLQYPALGARLRGGLGRDPIRDVAAGAGADHPLLRHVAGAVQFLRHARVSGRDQGTVGASLPPGPGRHDLLQGLRAADRRRRRLRPVSRAAGEPHARRAGRGRIQRHHVPD